MNRRAILKSFWALSFAHYLEAIPHLSGQVQIPNSVKLMIILDGPFGTILHTTDSDRIRVVTPMDDSHHFYLNNAEQARDKKHNIILINDLDITPNENPDLSDAGLAPFHWNSSVDQSVSDNLIDMDLPSPDRIQTYSYFQPPANAVFKSNRSTPMPSGYYLEYDNVSSPENIRMTDNLKDQPIGPLKVTLPNSTVYVFVLEVGIPLDRGNEPDQDGHLAVNFHNQKLLKRFPDILHDRDKQLTSITLSPSRQSKDEKHILQLPASAVECKAGGVVITTDP